MLAGKRETSIPIICEPPSTRSAEARSVRSTPVSRRCQPFSIRGRVLQSSLRLGEGADREERSRHARHRLWQPTPHFPSLDALNDWLEMRCRELWAQTLHGSQPGAIVDVWAEEVGRLMQLSRPFDGFVEYAKRVSPTCLVHLDRNRYSAPASFANRPVSLRVYPERIVVAEGQIVCEHRRVFARSHERKSATTVYDWRHLSGGRSTQARGPAQ